MVTVKLLIAFAVPASHALLHRSGKAIMHSRKFEKIRPAFYTLLAEGDSFTPLPSLQLTDNQM